jgi:cytochrome d ubiquinol oxidase subunit I
MSILNYSRALMALTLGFHMLFAALGVGVPLMISIAHFLGLKRKDPDLIKLSERWTKGFTILFAVGTVTGTVVGFQLSLLWPHFMALAGKAIALPLFIETFAFLTEAVFFGLYAYGKGWFKKTPWVHWALSVPIAIAATASAGAISTMNSFMNTPAGFDLVNGVAVNVRPWEAMMNPSTPVRVGHVVLTAWAATAFVLAAVAAWKLMKGEKLEYHRKALRLTLVTGLIMSLITGYTGDASAKFLAEHQPIKLAAVEGLFQTVPMAPLAVGGIPDPTTGKLKGPRIEVPGALSFMAWSDFHKPVQGLWDFPKEVWPPLFIHMTFDMMVGAAGLMILLSAFYCWRWFRQKKSVEHPLFLGLVVATGVYGMIAIEAGWVTAEVGRAPWILWGIMKTTQAVTDSPAIPTLFWTFAVFYTLVGIAAVSLLRWYFRKHPLVSTGGDDADESRLAHPPVQEAFGHD